MPVLSEVTDLKRTYLHADGGAAYKSIAPHVAEQEFIDRSAGEYVRGNAGTNLVEGFFSPLKRSIDGTHHHVSTEHLHRYLAQFDFVYNHCRETDAARMRRLIGNVEGRRVTYKPLTSNVGF